MICRFNLKSVMLFSLLCIVSPLSQAQGAPAAGPSLNKEGTAYIATGVNFNRFKSIQLIFEGHERAAVFNQPYLTAHTTATSLTLGTYVTDHIRTEVRLGKGMTPDKIGGGALELNLGEYFNWYMGVVYPITDYADVYAQYGLSFYNADVTRYTVQLFDIGDQQTPGKLLTVYPSRTEMEEELFGEHFSTSWLVGVDFSIIGDWYWTFEYGRLLNDADTGIKVYQFNSLIKYEF